MIKKQLKRGIAVLAVLVMLLNGLTIASFADGQLQGDGTEDNPYVVTTAAQLAELGEKDKVGYVRLGNDIDMTGIAAKQCIIKKLTGEFNGGGHTISNLTLVGGKGSSRWDTGTVYVNTGLIGELSGTVRDVKLTNVTIESGIEQYNNVGTLVGQITDGESAAVDNCIVSGGKISVTNDKSNICIGGLVGMMNGGEDAPTSLTVNNCISDVTAAGTNYSYIGGILGSAQYYSDVVVRRCAVFGSNGGSSSNSGGNGGIVGLFMTGSYATLDISDSIFAGTLSGFRRYGIAFNQKNLKALKCSNFYYDSNKNSSLTYVPKNVETVTGAEGKSTAELKALTLDGFESSEKFDGYPVPKWTPSEAPAEYSAVLDNDGNAVVSAAESGDCLVVFAAHRNGCLTGCAIVAKTLEKGKTVTVTAPESFNKTGADSVRVMLWSTAMQPFAASQQ